MKLQLFSLAATGLMLAACGNPPADPANEPDEGQVPSIGADMAMPTDKPFCVFVREDHTGPLTSEAARYVLVTEVGTSVYHAYLELDGEVTRLVEVEAGFGGGIETRRYANEGETREFEVILLEQNPDTDEQPLYTGSVRQIYPVEGEAVKFRGECGLDDTPDSTTDTTNE